MAGERKDTFDRCLVQQERSEAKTVVAEETDLRGDERDPNHLVCRPGTNQQPHSTDRLDVFFCSSRHLLSPVSEPQLSHRASVKDPPLLHTLILPISQCIAHAYAPLMYLPFLNDH